MMQENVFVIKIVNRVQFVILTFKMLRYVMEMAGVNKLPNFMNPKTKQILNTVNGNVNVVKVTTKEIEIIHRLFLVIAMYCQASSMNH